MIRSGLNVPRPAMPMPALDVPYAAPTVENTICVGQSCAAGAIGGQLTALVTPANLYLSARGSSTRGEADPKKGAHGGHKSVMMSDVVANKEDNGSSVIAVREARNCPRHVTCERVVTRPLIPTFTATSLIVHTSTCLAAESQKSIAVSADRSKWQVDSHPWCG